MSYPMLTSAEVDVSVQTMGELHPSELEAFYRDALLKSILPRGTPSQRERLYNAFKRYYEAKSRRENYKPKQTVLDKHDWMHPGDPTKTTVWEEQMVKNIIRGATDPDELRSYYSHVKANIFPRAQGHKYSDAVAYKNNIEEMYHHYMAKLEKQRERQKNIRKEAQRAKDMPDKGTTVKMDGYQGTVIDKGLTIPRVKVRWTDGGTEWVDIKYLTW